MAKLLDGYWQLGNSKLLCLVLYISHVRYQELSCQLYLLRKGHHLLGLQYDFELHQKIYSVRTYLSNSSYSSTDLFCWCSTHPFLDSFCFVKQEYIHLIHCSNSLAIDLLFEASPSVLIIVRMRWGITIAQFIVVSELESFKVADMISFKVSLNLKPAFLGSVKNVFPCKTCW